MDTILKMKKNRLIIHLDKVYFKYNNLSKKRYLKRRKELKNLSYKNIIFEYQLLLSDYRYFYIKRKINRLNLLK